MTKIVTLKDENCHANIGNSLRNEVIKEMCKELKEVTLEVRNKFLWRKFTIFLVEITSSFFIHTCTTLISPILLK